MIVIKLAEKGGEPKRLSFDQDEVSIGRVDGNDIVLAKGNVSKQHSKLVLRGNELFVKDLASTNGTFVNGSRIRDREPIVAGDRIQIGDFTLEARAEPKRKPAPREEAEERRPEPRDAPRSGEDDEQPLRPPDSRPPKRRPEPPPREAPRASSKERTDDQAQSPRIVPPRPRRNIQKIRQLPPDVQAYVQLQRKLHDRLIEHLDLRRTMIDQLGDDELWAKTEKAAREILNQMAVDGEIPATTNREMLITDVLNEALGLGPLEQLLADDDISEVMVNHAQQVYIERKGKLTLSNKIFSSDRAVLGVIERIVAPIGRRIDESSPMVDARLKDGSRVNAIIPPLALKGPSLTIRKFKKEPLQSDDLVKMRTLTTPMAEFLESCVRARRNMLISGGTGSGKTTTLNVISSFIPETERIVTIEDAAELQLHQEHWVQLESRPPNLEGKGQITIRDLVKNSLRMRPDRIVVGECRSGEALDMLQAMNTGHDGSLTTLHANTPRDALARLETLVLMSGMDLPIKAIREQIASAVHLIIQQTRFGDGSRRITAITEIAGMEVDIITLQDIFYYKQDGFDENGRVRGRFLATGFVPHFYEEMQKRGVPVNMEIFREDVENDPSP